MRDNEYVVTALERLDNKFEKLNGKVDKLSEILGKQELILEKILHIDNRISNVSKVVHKRVDELCERVHDIEENQAKHGCSQLNSLRAQRDEQVKAFSKEAEVLTRGVAKNRTDIEELKAIPNQIAFKVVTAVITTAVIGAFALYFGGKK